MDYSRNYSTFKEIFNKSINIIPDYLITMTYIDVKTGVV